jgi:hypothetical protein
LVLSYQIKNGLTGMEYVFHAAMPPCRLVACLVSLALIADSRDSYGICVSTRYRACTAVLLQSVIVDIVIVISHANVKSISCTNWTYHEFGL